MTGAWSRRSCRTVRVSGPRSSAGSCRITCSVIATDGREKATSEPLKAPLVRAQWRTAMRKAWSAIPAATSWCRSRGSRPGTRSTPIWKTSAVNVRRMSCAASPRRSVNASRGILRRCPNFRRHHSMPAIRPPDGSAPRHWCATRPTITRCRSPMATATSGSGAMSERWSSAAVARSSRVIHAAMIARTWSSIRFTTFL